MRLSERSAEVEEAYRRILVGEDRDVWRGRDGRERLPSDPRCKLCSAPFRGPGALLMRLSGRTPFPQNPLFCQICFKDMQQHPGGAEIELSFVFADVRDSTALAERMRPADVTRLLNRFYAAATGALVRNRGMIERYVGDQAVGLFIPALAGPEHARRAADAARAILRATGHGGNAPPWIRVGVGVHSGTAYVGTVEAGGRVSDISAFGDAVNTAARIASMAGAGEILISEDAVSQAQLAPGATERRLLELKGKSTRVAVRVLPSL